MNNNNLVYKFYNQNGELLYVGITNNFKIRVKQHKMDKTWFGEVDKILISDDNLTVNESHIYEIYYIANESPKYNITHSESGEVRFKLEELNFKEYKKSLKRNVEKTNPMIINMFNDGLSIEEIANNLGLGTCIIRRRMQSLGLIDIENPVRMHTEEETKEIINYTLSDLCNKIETNEINYFTDEDIKITFAKLYGCKVKNANKKLKDNKIYNEYLKNKLSELNSTIKKVRSNKKLKEEFNVIENGYPFIFVKS